MNATEVVALITSILVLIGGLELRIKVLVKHYLSELKPNSGSSMKDQINRLEERQQAIFLHIMDQNNKS